MYASRRIVSAGRQLSCCLFLKERSAEVSHGNIPPYFTDGRACDGTQVFQPDETLRSLISMYRLFFGHQSY
jgi:hypothetical protein